MRTDLYAGEHGEQGEEGIFRRGVARTKTVREESTHARCAL